MKTSKAIKSKTLQDIIHQSGYTIREFCQVSGISQSGLYSYLSGEREPSLEKTLAMSRVLKISLKQLASLLGKDVTGIPND